MQCLDKLQNSMLQNVRMLTIFTISKSGRANLRKNLLSGLQHEETVSGLGIFWAEITGGDRAIAGRLFYSWAPP